MTSDQLGRAVSLYRRTATSRSALVLLVANAIPIIGVVFFGWSLLTVLVLYWIENGIIGFWNVPKIVMAQGSIVPVLPELPPSAALAATRNAQAAADLQARWAQAREAQQAEQAAQQQAQVAARQAPPAPGTAGMAGMGTAMSRLAGVGRLGLAIFFTLHYGVFWVVHGLFVFALPAFGDGFGVGTGAGGVTCGQLGHDPFGVPGSTEVVCANGAFGDVIWSNVLLAAGALFLSHGASFLFNYIGRGEYIVQSAARQMAAPYARVIVLHVTIIVGSIVVAFLGAPIAALLILIGLKTAFDLGLHLREHRNAGPPLPKSTVGPI